MAGWIKLHRDIKESKTFQKLTAIQKLIAIYIVLNANHKDGFWYDNYKGTEVEVKRGQLITSRKKIVEEWFNNDKDVTEQKVRTALTKLSNLGFLTIESSNWYSLITVIKYEVYQGDDDESKMSDQSLTNSLFNTIEKSTSTPTNVTDSESVGGARALGREQHGVNQHSNQLLTSTQPAPNQHLTTNKNVKNEKNEKKDIKDIVPDGTTRTKFIPPLLEEVKTYCEERAKGVDPERWYDHYTANGWMVGKTKMKDWKAAVRTWEKNANQYSAVQTKKTKANSNFDFLKNQYGGEQVGQERIDVTPSQSLLGFSE